MIPHHAGAILMCGRATITDAELKKFCGEIVQGQQQDVKNKGMPLGRRHTSDPRGAPEPEQGEVFGRWCGLVRAARHLITGTTRLGTYDYSAIA
jgi:hypothetical protein